MVDLMNPTVEHQNLPCLLELQKPTNPKAQLFSEEVLSTFKKHVQQKQGANDIAFVIHK
jgi:hypothetical protein